MARLQSPHQRPPITWISSYRSATSTARADPQPQHVAELVGVRIVERRRRVVHCVRRALRSMLAAYRVAVPAGVDVVAVAVVYVDEASARRRQHAALRPFDDAGAHQLVHWQFLAPADADAVAQGGVGQQDDGCRAW